MEYLGKRMMHGGLNASCVPPDLYGQRFVSFMQEIFKSNYYTKPKLDKSKSVKVENNLSLERVKPQTHSKVRNNRV